MKIQIYLVRHGQTEWNLQHRYQGSGNSPLTKLGEKQAQALSLYLEDTHFDAIYCSPAGRAQQTAKIVKAKRSLEIVTVDDFQEINLGEWEGQLYDSVKAKEPKLYHAFWHSPDLFKPAIGESFDDVGKRTFAALQKIVGENQGKRILIVSHAAAIKSILNKIQGIPLKQFWEKKLFQTSLSILEFENGGFTVAKYGATEHLDR